MKHLNDNNKTWKIIKSIFFVSNKVDDGEFFQPISTQELKKIILELNCNYSNLTGPREIENSRNQTNF